MDAVKLLHPNFKVVFTGHSLGGALSTMAALDYYDKYGGGAIRNAYLYTYGSPKVGNKVFADWFSSLPFGGIYRLAHVSDIGNFMSIKNVCIWCILNKLAYSGYTTNIYL